MLPLIFEFFALPFCLLFSLLLHNNYRLLFRHHVYCISKLNSLEPFFLPKVNAEHELARAHIRQFRLKFISQMHFQYDFLGNNHQHEPFVGPQNTRSNNKDAIFFPPLLFHSLSFGSSLNLSLSSYAAPY